MLICKAKSSFNRTKVELKYHFLNKVLKPPGFQSYQSGIEMVEGRGYTLHHTPFNRTKVELKWINTGS